MLWRNVFDRRGGGGLIVSVICGGIWVWLCWFGFDCVDLGLLWLVSWSGFNLGWFGKWVYGFDLLRIWCWLCKNLGKNMKNSMILICSRSNGAGFNDLCGVEFEFFHLIFIYVLVIWVWVLGLLGLSSWVAGFVFLWWVWVLGCWVWFVKNMKNKL